MLRKSIVSCSTGLGVLFSFSVMVSAANAQQFSQELYEEYLRQREASQSGVQMQVDVAPPQTVAPQLVQVPPPQRGTQVAAERSEAAEDALPAWQEAEIQQYYLDQKRKIARLVEAGTITDGQAYLIEQRLDEEVRRRRVNAVRSPMQFDLMGNPIRPQQTQSLPGALPEFPDGVIVRRAKPPVKLPELRDPKEQAAEEVLRELFPFSPDELAEYRAILNDVRRESSMHQHPMPRLVTTATTADLSPGSEPTMVRLGQSATSSINFIDASGKPWPISKYRFAPAEGFLVDWQADNNPHEIGVTPRGAYVHGNLTVFLAGMGTPVSVRFVAGSDEIDVRRDVKIPARGPNATAVISAEMPGENNSAMMSFLNGRTPSGAKKLSVHGAPAEAWLLDGRMYLRVNNISVRSPMWTGSESSLDGTAVYEMVETPVVLASRAGKDIQLVIEGF